MRVAKYPPTKAVRAAVINPAGRVAERGSGTKKRMHEASSSSTPAIARVSKNVPRVLFKKRALSEESLFCSRERLYFFDVLFIKQKPPCKTVVTTYSARSIFMIVLCFLNYSASSAFTSTRLTALLRMRILVRS